VSDALWTGRTATERYECKYRIPPSLVPEIRKAIRKYCDSDAASGDGPYRVASLYLDSPNRILYRHTKEHRARRFKLRVRRYFDGLLFFEIKRRVQGVIVKSRVGIDPAYWPAIAFDSRLVDRCGLSTADERTLQEFLDRRLQLHAEPAVVVRYRREAYVSRVDDYGRVTFDFHLEGLPANGYAIPISDEAGWQPFDVAERFGLPVSGVILELKCLTRVPLWMSDLVARFDLRALGFSKYSAALEAVSNFPWNGELLREPSRRVGGLRW
jgi:hypothetical protein